MQRRKTNLALVPTELDVDLKKFAGLWFEISKFPFAYEPPGTYDVTSYYGLDDPKDPNTFSIINSSKEMIDDDHFKPNFIHGVATAVGFTDPRMTTSKFRVTFDQTKTYGNLWILIFNDSNEKVCVLGSETQLWVLSREPHMDAYLYGLVLEDIQRRYKDRYDVSKLRMTYQSKSTVST